MNYWSQFARGTNFFALPIPGYAALPLLFWLLYPTVLTFLIAIGVVIALTILKIKGRKVPWVVRRAYSSLRGGVVHARTVFYRRQILRASL